MYSVYNIVKDNILYLFDDGASVNSSLMINSLMENVLHN